MNEKGYPWDSYGDDKREYGAQHLANAFGRIMKNGTVNQLTDFLVTPLESNKIRIGSGQAWINGHTVQVIGYEDMEIPFAGAASSGKSYGRLVLSCREETDYRDFQFLFKPSVNGETPNAESNEISIARIADKRESLTVLADDIIRDISACACVNSDIIAGNYTDVSGLIAGAEGKVVQALPGINYAPPLTTGTWNPVSLKGDFTISNVLSTEPIGLYAKLDKLVLVRFYGELGISRNTGYISIKGLPYHPTKFFIGMTEDMSVPYSIVTENGFSCSNTFPTINKAANEYCDSVMLEQARDSYVGGITGGDFLGEKTPSANITWKFSLLYVTDE